MKERFLPLLPALRDASSGAKGVAVLVALTIALVLGVSGYVATRPDWSFLYSDLDDLEASAVVDALAQAGIDFERGGMHAPYSIQVERSDRSSALAAIAQAGVLSSARGGIQTEGGAASIFQGSQERAQAVRKREWQETEDMLQTLDFVYRASVGSSAPEQSVFGPRVPVTASVALTLRGQEELSREQARTVAQLVRFRLGVSPEGLVISDQAGRSLWNGAAEAEDAASGSDWLDMKLRYDRLMEEKANEDLASILGLGRARVRVNSEWDTDQRSTISTTTDPDSAVAIRTETKSRQTPQGMGSRAGGPPGTASNSPQDASGVAGSASGTNVPPVAKENDEQTSYVVDQVREQSVKVAPLLKRLSIALFVDDDVGIELPELEGAVKAAVSFVEGRDGFQAVQLAFHVDDAPAEPGGDAGSGGILGTLIDRGVELLAALAFVLLFFKALKGMKRKPREGDENENSEVVLDPLALAREQVAQLVREDPGRVGEILSSWVVEDRATVGSKR